MPRPFRFAVQSYNASSAAQWRDRARQAEDLGYSALHLADHYVGPGRVVEQTSHPVQELAAVPAIMAAANATSRLRVGCRVFCVDYHHPVVLAKQAATLDLLSEGRLELGLGAGWLRAEYEALRIPFDPPGQRIRRLAATIALVKQSMGGADAPFEAGAAGGGATDAAASGAAGAARTAHGVPIAYDGFAPRPLPAQRPHPPIMVGGGGRRVLSLAAREADIVSLNFNNRAGVIGPDGVQSGAAAATAEKIGWLREAAAERMDAIELEIGAYFTFVQPGAETIAGEMGRSLGLSAEEMLRHPHGLFGEAEAVADELRRRREHYGIHYITVPDSALTAFAPVVAQLAGS